MMTRKLRHYIQLAGETVAQVAQNTENRVDFLNTAAHLYRCSFPAQLLIRVRRPKATACAEYDLWSKHMGRYIRHGSKGIGLIGISRSGYPKLCYVFDITDTGKRNESARFFQGKYKQEYQVIVTRALEERVGVSGEKGLAYQIGLLSVKLVNRYWKSYYEDIMHECKGSRFEGLEEQKTNVKFRLVAAAIISYVLLSRCGFDPWKYLKSKEFQNIPDFNTQKTIRVLGAAVSQSSEQALRTSAVAIYNHEHQKTAQGTSELCFCNEKD